MVAEAEGLPIVEAVEAVAGSSPPRAMVVRAAEAEAVGEARRPCGARTNEEKRLPESGEESSKSSVALTVSGGTLAAAQRGAL